MLRMNVKGVGVDCEEIKRFEKMTDALIEKIFTKGEIAYCSKKAKPAQHLAARFAAKEAVVKCFGSMGKSVLLDQIEILNRKDGSPHARVHDKNLKAHDVLVSLSHSGGMAIAFAAITGGDQYG